MVVFTQMSNDLLSKFVKWLPRRVYKMAHHVFQVLKAKIFGFILLDNIESDVWDLTRDVVATRTALLICIADILAIISRSTIEATLISTSCRIQNQCIVWIL